MTIQNQEAAEEGQSASQDERKTEYRMDGGLQAWLQVLGSWILFANTWGLTNSFGVFETFYTESLLETSSASAISWIGSIQLFLTMVIGVFAGWFLDAGHLQPLLIIGTFLEIFGMFMTSLCTEYWQILLAQGICVGLGSGLLGLTSVAVIPLYFSEKRMIALGIAATGSSLAGIIYPIMMRRLFVSAGFPWAVRALAFLMLGCLVVCCAIMRLRPRPPQSTSLVDFKHIRDPSYMAFVAAFTLMMASVYVPFFYIQKYALQFNIDDDMAFYLLSMMNASSLIGRIGPNLLADYIGGLNVMAPACFLSAVVLFVFRFAVDLPGLIVIALFYGLISGGMVSLPAAIIANLTSKPSELGSRIGLAYTIAAFGALIGNPIAGACLRPSGTSSSDVQREYQGVWIFGGAFMLLSTGCVILTRYLNSKTFTGNKM
ncbi:MFS general substrate transporter [Penicillium coprophilum]|uniref:MFS general substrate transporter n=1 Tax=Penicillium coprophilum TaxID=36646 RepID=UPI00238E6DA8|nr:MFS general substrate transporter [Penicillium coprophilum]KAJ5173657.1 MFS general substrate transporter [Penicillium coprophilum]